MSGGLFLFPTTGKQPMDPSGSAQGQLAATRLFGLNVGRRKSPEDILSINVLLEAMGKRAERLQSEKKGAKSTSGLGNVILFTLQIVVKSTLLKEGVLLALSLALRAWLGSK